MTSRPNNKRVALLLPGLGAVSTTLIAGIELHRQGKNVLIGSLTQTGLMSATAAGEEVPIANLVPLIGPEQIAFGCWDIQPDDAYEAARRAGVLQPEDLEQVAPVLKSIRPKPGLHDARFVRRLQATHTIGEGSHREKIAQLRRDINDFMTELKADRAVMVFCASTEAHHGTCAAYASARALEQAIDDNDPRVSPTIMYCYAALQEGVPFANGTPNISCDTPALQEIAIEKGIPMAGKDFKSGQTMLKTVIAPALKARMLGLNGWFSTNILGNRDGEVLDDPDAFRSKEVTKTGVLDTILDGKLYPHLYGNIQHKVAIHYYPPRGDAKEGWDNIDIFGWMNYPMQIKVNFLCRDSILAAPLLLDVALFLDLAHTTGRSGLQQWMSFYFKCPVTPAGTLPQHDLFAQLATLTGELRAIARQQKARRGEPADGRPAVALARS